MKVCQTSERPAGGRIVKRTRCVAFIFIPWLLARLCKPGQYVHQVQICLARVDDQRFQRHIVRHWRTTNLQHPAGESEHFDKGCHLVLHCTRVYVDEGVVQVVRLIELRYWPRSRQSGLMCQVICSACSGRRLRNVN
jgi:hypothetical protein